MGKPLAYNTRQKVTQDVIISIKDNQGQIVRGYLSVLNVFKDYYSEFYQQESQPSCDLGERISQYLSKTPGLRLLADESCQLATPITLDEITAALGSLPNGKATGPDMIPMYFFKFFLGELEDDILALFKSVEDGVQVLGS
ncbi:hypothetical protein NDU88_005710 [Pleurodeles waltl]|uniref:Uncharacterized protein n=1 Tax=Pleurodeles waltl TaxID=8319 RepID=A0AAV7MBU3_PLEWA|nr:hypothetical protein NDU88_005710 [Pleurodeles waltl]